MKTVVYYMCTDNNSILIRNKFINCMLIFENFIISLDDIYMCRVATKGHQCRETVNNIVKTI